MGRKGVITALFGWNVIQLIIAVIVIIGLILVVVWILGLIKFL